MIQSPITRELFQRLLKTQRLPSPSAVALRVLELADREDVAIDEIAEAISADPVIAARLFKYANSPLAASRQEITSIRHAVMHLGIQAVKVTTLGFSLVKQQDFSRCPHFNFDHFWAHAIATAISARFLIAKQAPNLREEAFVAGLLARIGKLALAMAIPEDYERVLSKTGNVMRGCTAEERAAFSTDNIELGAELLAQWKLPALFVEAVRQQANPDAATTSDARRLASAVHEGRRIADQLCGLVAKPQTADGAVVDVELLAGQFRDVAALLNISLKELPDPDEVENRARGLLGDMSMASQAEISTLQTKNRDLARQALVDTLTGIGNRKAFDQHLASELERAKRFGRVLSLLMIDIDTFKNVNDTYGHVTGDGVLVKVAGTIRKILRNFDFAARYGGEEFAVIASETDLESAVELAERLRKAVQAEPYSCSDGTLRLTVSIGIVSCIAHAKLEPLDLVAAADSRLYHAKQSGRNKCCSVLLGEPVTPNLKSGAPSLAIPREPTKRITPTPKTVGRTLAPATNRNRSGGTRPA
ncbi:MAG TPA: GGDEF domain-containing protein [Phycisphaerae bacterium]|nr:GGDEF domain-containing protein [Phycisphaerae bacterium]